MISRGRESNGWNIQDLNNMIKAIETQRGDVARYGRVAEDGSFQAMPEDAAAEVVEAVTNAEAATFSRATLFEDSAVKELSAAKKMPDGTIVPRVSNAKWRNTVLKSGDTTALDDVLEVVGNDPMSRAAIGSELLQMYRKAVFKDGKFQRGAHDAFLDKNAYGDHVRSIFGDSAPDLIKNAQRFSNEAKASTASG